MAFRIKVPGSSEFSEFSTMYQCSIDDIKQNGKQNGETKWGNKMGKQNGLVSLINANLYSFNGCHSIKPWTNSRQQITAPPYSLRRLPSSYCFGFFSICCAPDQTFMKAPAVEVIVCAAQATTSRPGARSRRSKGR